MIPKRWRPELCWHRPGFDPLTISCLLLLLCQLVTFGMGGFAGNPTLYQQVGLSRPEIMSGKVWQLVSYGLLHGSWIHFLVNWLMIYFIGAKLTNILGDRSFLKIFWGGVVVGGVFHLLLHPTRPLGLEGEVANAPLVGASAGAMALVVALTALSPDSKMWPLPVRGRNLMLGLLISALLLYLLNPGLGIPGFSALGAWAVEAGLAELFQLAHACHLGGGLLGGWIAMRILKKPITLAELQEERARKESEIAA